jgi:uncharacterized membrane protein YcaP (DUF421 family)
MHWLTGDWTRLGEVAAKALLMYGTALIALRLGERRTVARWTLIDFAAAVALGAIIGRTAVSRSQSYVTGAVAIVVIVLIHRLVSVVRFTQPARRVMDHRVRVLVEDGKIREHDLRVCGLSDDDLFVHLRQRGVFSLEGIRYVLYEPDGELTIVPRPAASDGLPPLVAAGLSRAAAFTERADAEARSGRPRR